jgi:enamine deaminase RidA (YjgF/YER057c/UK114 family)
MEKRRSIEVGGVKHVNPIPSASRKGPFVVSGAISGADPETGKLPAELDAQCHQMFNNVRRVMSAAGGSPDDIVKMTVWIADRSLRENAEPPLGRDVPRPAFAAGPPYRGACRFHAADADPMRHPRGDRCGAVIATVIVTPAKAGVQSQ